MHLPRVFLGAETNKQKQKNIWSGTQLQLMHPVLVAKQSREIISGSELSEKDQERWSHLAAPLRSCFALPTSVSFSSVFTVVASGNFLVFVLYRSFTCCPLVLV